MKPRIYYDRKAGFWAVDLPYLKAAYWGHKEGAKRYAQEWWEKHSKRREEEKK